MARLMGEDMEIKFIESGLSYKISEGMTLIENYNDKLDSATIIVSQLTNEIEGIKPYQEVMLHDENGVIPDKYMCINNFRCTELNVYEGHETYRYDIELISQTKLLELCSMPNIDTYNLVGRSIYAYMQMANDLYGQKQQLDGVQYVTNKWNFSTRLITKFNAITCPEIYFNKPTLREFLNKLALVSDCLVTLNNHIIDYIDIGEKNSQLTNTPINRTVKSMNGEDYLSSIKMNLSNVIGNNAIEKTLLPIGAGDNGIINSGSIALYTEFPIYNVYKFGEIASYSLIYTETGTTTGEKVAQSEGNYFLEQVYDKDGYPFRFIDLLNEKQLFITKDITASVGSYEPSGAIGGSYKTVKNYQNTTINYTRYSNKIDNFSCQSVRSIWDVVQIYTNVMNIMNNCAQGALYNTTFQYYPSGKTYYMDHLQIFSFEASGENPNLLGSAYAINYIPVSFSCVKFYKDGITNLNADVIDNQEEAYIDPSSLGTYEHSKVKRLGNEIKLKTGRIELPVSTGVEVPYVGDYFNDDEVIYQIEYQIFKNVLKYNLYTCKHYILKSNFTSINSKLHSWRIVDNNEAFYRDENITHFLMFSRKKKSIDEQMYRYMPLQQYTDTATMKSLLGIKNVVYCTDINDNCSYEKTLVKEIAEINYNARTITYNFGFNDNYIGAKKLTSETVYSGTIAKQIKYADDNGEVKEYRLDFYSQIMQRPEQVSNHTTIVATDADNWAKSKVDELKQFVLRYPHMVGDGIGHTREYNYLFSIIPQNSIYKNNKEILRFTYQISLIGDDEFIMTDAASIYALLNNYLKWYIYKEGYTGDKIATTATITYNDLLSTTYTINKVSGYNGYIECCNSADVSMMMFKQTNASTTQEIIYLLLKCFK